MFHRICRDRERDLQQRIRDLEEQQAAERREWAEEREQLVQHVIAQSRPEVVRALRQAHLQNLQRLPQSPQEVMRLQAEAEQRARPPRRHWPTEPQMDSRPEAPRPTPEEFRKDLAGEEAS